MCVPTAGAKAFTLFVKRSSTLIIDVLFIVEIIEPAKVLLCEKEKG